MTLYMLDTNTVSYFVRSQSAVDRHILETPVESLCVSSITAGELLFALAKRPPATAMVQAVHEFLSRVDVLPWDFKAARHYGTFKAALQHQGKLLGPLDLLIATHAMTIGAILVSSDRAFQRVPDLQVEDWTR